MYLNGGQFVITDDGMLATTTVVPVTEQQSDEKENIFFTDAVPDSFKTM